MEKKYIVKLDDNKLAYTAIIIDGVPYIKPLQLLPYTEPDTSEVYQRGLSDAWDAARKICLNECDGGMTPTEVNKIFGVGFYRDALLEYSASECIEKIRQYEQEKNEIKVGDEVKNIECGWTAIVTKSEEGHLTLMCDSGAIANGYDAKYFAKTGRHFHEIAAVLEKMREDAT